MSKKKSIRVITGGRMEIRYPNETEPIKDDANSLAFKRELHEWNANPRKWWWEHGGKEKVIKVIIITIISAGVLAFLLLR